MTSPASKVGAKLFVGGLPWETKEEALMEHFGRYGEVAEAVVVRDRFSGTSRGFGFVCFTDAVAAERALREPRTSHVIMERKLEVKKAFTREAKEQNHHNDHRQHQFHGGDRGVPIRCSSTVDSYTDLSGKKIFVGGLAPSVTEVELKSFFERYGRITDAVVMFDNTTHRARGFGFITFESEEAVEDVLKQNFHELNGKTVEVKRAVPRDKKAESNGGANSNSNPSCSKSHASSNSNFNFNSNGQNCYEMGHGWPTDFLYYEFCRPYASLPYMPCAANGYYSTWMYPRSLCNDIAIRGLQVGWSYDYAHYPQPPPPMCHPYCTRNPFFMAMQGSNYFGGGFSGNWEQNDDSPNEASNQVYMATMYSGNYYGDGSTNYYIYGEK